MGKEYDAYRQTNLSLSARQRVDAIMEALTQDPDYKGWDTELLRDVKVESVETGKVVFTTAITPAMCNKANNLHGGCATTLLDNLSSSTFVTLAKEGHLDTGSVSRTLNVTLLRPVPVGTKVRIVCEAVSAGKNLALCKGQIELLDGRVAVTCTHDKAIVHRARL